MQQSNTDAFPDPGERDGSTAQAVADAASRVSALDLRAAVDLIVRSKRGTSPNPAEFADVLVTLANAIEARAGGGTDPIDQRLACPLGRHMLEEFRRTLAATWLQGELSPSPSRILAVWKACDDVLEAIDSGDEQVAAFDWEGEFSRQMTGPRGLELVVEVAHDLRSPLTSILFLAETLQRGQSGTVNEIQRRQLGLVYSAALGLSTLASNVMELARGGSHLADDQPAPFSLAEVFESVADIVRPMAEEKGLAVRLLPPTPDYRLGPAQALSRVLLNLTTNAIKFTEEGFVEVVGRRVGEHGVEFSVRDTGPGINPLAVPTLFHAFRPGPDGKRAKFSGTGLGLALCRKLVGAMDSELEYESNADWGTRFFFELELEILPR